MIIPSLFRSHLADDTNEDFNSDDEDDDGLTAQERENVRNVLASLAGTDLGGGASTLSGQRIRSDLVLGDNERRSNTGVPITVPSNSISAPPAIAITRAAPIPTQTPAPVLTPVEAPPAPPVKMSRFKARQMGLQSDD
jgi:hypothetical protein